MKFKYTALGASNQKLEGVLDAESLDVAREELHKMGLSVVAINEVSGKEVAVAESQKKVQAEVKEGIITFYFLAKDTIGKEVNGTIDAKDANSAYRRLLTEYRFDVLDMYPQNAVNPATESSKPKFEEWKSQMEDEGIDITLKPPSSAKKDLEEEGGEMSEEIVAEMDQFIINTKKILSDHSDQYSDAFVGEIQKTLDDLERIRASNNIKHITKICNTLYELISNPDKVKTDETEGANEEYETTMSNLKGSGFITNSFQFLELHNLQKKLARFEKTQKLIAKVYKFVNRGKASEIDKRFAAKAKSRRAGWLSKIKRKFKKKKEDEHPTILLIASKFFAYISASNVILRRARKQDLAKTINEWKEYRKERKVKKKEVVTDLKPDAVTVEESKKDFSGFFMELDSFVGWLLFFYIGYFFIASFAIEKNVGMPKELVLKTFTTPLIINISIFLIIAHLAFTLKIRHFRSNFLGSLFLFFLCFGVYTILIVNF